MKESIGEAAAHVYVRRIRNVEKARYASEYLDYLVGLKEEPIAYGCSTMAAQAVRMTLREMVESAPSTGREA